MYSNVVPLESEERKASQLPKPTGYKLLIAVPKVEEKSTGGVIRPDSLIKAEETATIIGFVLEMGPDAYANPDKFPNGPWCQKGDFVVFRSYTGTRMRRAEGGQEFRLINDDCVEAVVDDPRGWQRA